MSAYPRVAQVISKQGTDLSDLINRLADVEQMPPRVMVACGIAESNLDEHANRYGTWPDVSFGLFQQTVAYAPLGDQADTAGNIERVRQQLWNPATAAEIAAPQLGHWWRETQDGPSTLGHYNWPARGLEGNPNKPHILKSWEASAQYVAPDKEAPMHSFQLGFADLAAQMQAAGEDPGTPLTDEYQTGPTNRQLTSTGEMIYAPGGQPMFLKAAAVLGQ